MTYISATATEEAGDSLKLLSNAMRNFCRSIELCDFYLRGYYGLKLVNYISNHPSKPYNQSNKITDNNAPITSPKQNIQQARKSLLRHRRRHRAANSILCTAPQ